jgi:hypothetical protein
MSKVSMVPIRRSRQVARQRAPELDCSGILFVRNRSQLGQGLGVHTPVVSAIGFLGTCRRSRDSFRASQKENCMTDHDFLLNPEHWRERAEETLAKAEQAWRPEARDRLLKIAKEYERLALRAEQWRSTRQSPSYVAGS